MSRPRWQGNAKPRQGHHNQRLRRIPDRLAVEAHVRLPARGRERRDNSGVLYYKGLLEYPVRSGVLQRAPNGRRNILIFQQWADEGRPSKTGHISPR